MRVKAELYYQKDWEVSIMLYYLFWYSNTIMFFCYSVRNYNGMTSEIWTEDNLWWKILGEILKGFWKALKILKGIENIEIFVTVEIKRCPGWNIFWNLINGGCGIRTSWVEIFLKITKQGGHQLEPWE